MDWLSFLKFNPPTFFNLSYPSFYFLLFTVKNTCQYYELQVVRERCELKGGIVSTTFYIFQNKLKLRERSEKGQNKYLINHRKQKCICESHYGYSLEYVRISLKLHSTLSRSFGIIFPSNVTTVPNSDCIMQFCLHMYDTLHVRMLQVVWGCKMSGGRNWWWFLPWCTKRLLP